jgi:hypothetical protein
MANAAAACQVPTVSSITQDETVEETTMTHANLTELAQRQNDGLEVTLFWARADDSVHVAVRGEAAGIDFAFPVDRSKALDAFYHPFAYAA